MKQTPKVSQPQFCKIQQHLFTTLLLALMAIALQSNYARHTSFTTKIPHLETSPISDMTQQLKAQTYNYALKLRLMQKLRQGW